MNKERIKYLIAREGLIILIISAISIGAIFFGKYISDSAVEPTAKKGFDLSTAIPVTRKEFDPEEYINSKPIEQDVNPLRERIKKAKEAAEARKKELAKQAAIGDKISIIGFMFLAAAYPVYLIVRFLFWSIKTVRKGYEL